MLTWIFFDVGGTLFDDEPVYHYQEQLIFDLLNKNGCQVTEREFASAVRAARRYYLPSYVTHLIWIFTEEPERFEKIKLEYEKKMNGTSYKKYREMVPLLPGMKDLVMDLSGRSSPGVMGNQTAAVWTLS